MIAVCFLRCFELIVEGKHGSARRVEFLSHSFLIRAACWEMILLFSPSLRTRERESSWLVQTSSWAQIHISLFVYIIRMKHTGSDNPIDKHKLKQMTTSYMQVWEEFRSIFLCFDQSSTCSRSLPSNQRCASGRACIAAQTFPVVLMVGARF